MQKNKIRLQIKKNYNKSNNRYNYEHFHRYLLRNVAKINPFCKTQFGNELAEKINSYTLCRNILLK